MKKHIIIPLFIFCGGAALAQRTYPIVDTKQELFYNDSRSIDRPKEGEAFYGQDAHHMGNTPSYSDNEDGTITDNVTGLMWQKEFMLLSYNEALEMAEGFTLGGHSDWRVPNIKEGYSLILFNGTDVSTRDMNEIPKGAIPFIDTLYFDFAYGANGTRTIDSQLLTTSISIGSSERQKLVFGVNLADGRIKSYPLVSRGEEKKYMVRFVRGAEKYGVNRFEELSNGTVSDLATGLMWQKSDSKKGLNWQEALEYAAKMNKKNYLGHNDWRVPNIKELQSIVDYTRSPETSQSAAIDPIFEISEIKNEAGERDYPFFWSSTTHCSTSAQNNGSAADYVSFGRALGNMPQTMGRQGGGQQQQRPQQQQGMRTQQRPQPQGNMGSSNSVQNRPNMGQQQSNSKTENWINIHGAGAQRSDPKSGDPSRYAGGRGPQGDAIRIYNYVRLVRDIE